MAESEKCKPGRIDGKNAAYHSGEHRIKSHVRHELALIFRQHLSNCSVRFKRKIISSSTEDKRKTVILGFFSDLFRLKFNIESVHGLKQKHLKAVFEHLEEMGQSPATIQNKISIMRQFCEWIGKNGMVSSSHEYVKNPLSVKRTMVVQEDKSWEGHGIDVDAKLAEIREDDKHVAGRLMLCYTFGLRIRESVMLNVYKSDDGNVLVVMNGTKGGRARYVQIDHEWQRKALDEIKTMVNKRTGKLMSRETVKQALSRTYYIMTKHGLTLANTGVSAHGLRHQYMQERFKEMTGIEAPIKGGNLASIERTLFNHSTGKLMERAGHSRLSIGSSYYGSRRRGRQPKQLSLDIGKHQDSIHQKS